MKGHDLKFIKDNNIKILGGVDEAGRGPLAGPVVASCVILKDNVKLKLVNDSKKLSSKKRKEALEEIKENALYITIGIATNQEIDQMNILEATKLAMKRAINQVEIPLDYILIDHVKVDLKIPSKSITKGDEISQVIAAASIVSKTYRDNLMAEYHLIYPNYGFNKHQGYPTRYHLDMIKQYGPSPIHRLTFKPLKELKE